MDRILKLSPIPSIKWLRHYGYHPASPSSVEKLVNTCPRQFDATYVGKHVKRIEFKDTVHTVEGKEVHRIAEEFMLNGTPIPQKWLDELPNFQETMDSYVRELDGAQAFSPEIKLSANSDGMALWDDSTVRCIADINIDVSTTHRVVSDYKTNSPYNAKGKYRSPYVKLFQIELIALLSFIENPQLQTLEARFEFLRYGLRYSYFFDRNKWTYVARNGKGKESVKDFLYPDMMNRYWAEQVSGAFRPRKGYLCESWCDVKDCEHHGEPMLRGTNNQNFKLLKPIGRL